MGSLLMQSYEFGVTRACGLVQISRSLFRYCRRRTDWPGLRERIEEFESLKLTDPEPEWVGPKVVLIRRLLADLESTLQ